MSQEPFSRMWGMHSVKKETDSASQSPPSEQIDTVPLNPLKSSTKRSTPITCTDSLLSFSLSPPNQNSSHPEQEIVQVDSEVLENELQRAIQLANRAIHTAAEQGDGAQVGMGCTCEAAWIARGQLILGHVGDSRTYLFRQGHLKQFTRDQTMVNRMVALGLISEDEAANHPRRHELEQALGSSHPLEVQMITEPLCAGDVLVLCSDGLVNHVTDRNIAEVLRNTHSAEASARRLVNLANALGGSDNVTVVVVRAT